jgi:ElaB/YqjD/DUF883 family membrane-anchored ribosome-binding protein
MAAVAKRDQIMANKDSTKPTEPAVDMAAGSAATAEAKSRFNAALDEAKAGAAALGDEALHRAEEAREQARAQGEDMAGQARLKAGELAVEGKARASEALSGLSRVIDENAALVDEKFGPKYGEYALTASQSLQHSAQSLDEKSVDELAEDAREAIRKSPATAVGLAALAGFLVARLFRR